MKFSRVYVGRRGRVLIFFGLLDLVYGFSLVYPDGEVRDGAFFHWLAAVAIPLAWAVVWVLTGLLCLVYAFQHHDQVGFAAAASLKVFWGLVCLGAWLFGGWERGYVAAMIWLGLAYLMARVFGPWPEPDNLRGPTWTRPSR